MLSQAEAEELILARLNSHFDSADFSIARNGVVERSFGWLFRIDAVQSTAGEVREVKPPRVVIVNKYSEQIIASSIDHEPELFIQLYEKLLTKNQARAGNWCSTGEFPWPWNLRRTRTIAERAKEIGFYEIGPEEKET
jgi:hypothetical protein